MQPGLFGVPARVGPSRSGRCGAGPGLAFFPLVLKITAKCRKAEMPKDDGRHGEAEGARR
jgi:hypothetical protein